MKDKPQLSAKMEKRFDETFSYEWWKGFGCTDDIDIQGKNGIKHFLATALEEQRLRYIEQVEEMINTKYPLNRFTDSYTGVMSRGKQMPTSVVPLSPDDEEAVSFLEFILNQLKGQK